MITCPHCGQTITSIEPSKPQRLLCEIEMVELILGSGATWEYKYDRIFGMSKGIRGLIDELDISFSWCEPDATSWQGEALGTSYKEDVTAYVEALRVLRENVIKELASASAAGFIGRSIKEL